MTISLDKINPEFRNAVDLFFFSNRTDIDLSNFKNLIFSSKEHLSYLLIGFSRAVDIFFLESDIVWYHKLQKLYALNNKNICKHISSTIDNNFLTLLKKKSNIDVNYDNEYVQFIQLCKVKFGKNHDLSDIKLKLSELPNYVSLPKVIEIVNYLIPYVYRTMEDFTSIIIAKITTSTKNLDLLLYLDSQGIKYDKKILISLAENLLFERALLSRNILAFFSLLNQDFILSHLKTVYSPAAKERIIEIFKEADYRDIDGNHLTNIKNIIKLDPELINDVQIIYADKLYARDTGHVRANADKLIRLLQIIPESSAKKILSYLSSKNKISDIKYIVKSFPNLQKLSMFI